MKSKEKKYDYFGWIGVWFVLSVICYSQVPGLWPFLIGVFAYICGFSSHMFYTIAKENEDREREIALGKKL